MGISERVASRFIHASLEQELIQRMDRVFASFDDDLAAETAKWLEKTLRFKISRTPPGAKKLKDQLDGLHWFLTNAGKKTYGGDSNLPSHLQQHLQKIVPGDESAWNEAKRRWEALKPSVPEIVRYFSDEGGKVVPKEVSVGGVTYTNLVGFDEKALAKITNSLDEVFRQVKGWRRKALDGLKVTLADPKKFHGTAGGKYKADEDALYVRATPAVLKRTRGTYGALDYILIHELGHRYDRKHGTKFDFDRQEWWTTPYSRNGGDEPFAELFALSNFDIKGPWDPVVKKFEDLMGA